MPAAAGAILLFLAACVSFPPVPAATTPPRLQEDVLISFDGARLGLSAWKADEPRAVLLAVHGMNDYARAFVGLGEQLAREEGVTVYAYDQRGFGRSPGFGRWHGRATLVADLRAAIAAARDLHPGAPVYVTGHSMGAAVVLGAMKDGPLDVDGVILAAPGVWGGARLPVAYRAALNVSASLLPGKTLTGERTGRRSTDNTAVLREMFEDPLIIKETRLDAVLGVVRLMGAGWDASNEVGGRILLVYGEKDEIIPVKAMEKLARRFCGAVETRAYPEGWHLLYRDLQAEKVWRDVADWISAQANAASPVSGAGPAAFTCAEAEDGDQGRRSAAWAGGPRSTGEQNGVRLRQEGDQPHASSL